MSNTYMLGVMQGRLLPKYKGRYQAHPVGYWQEEFYAAAELGLDLIEFILDYNDVEQNPLLSTAGLNEIMHISRQTGVRVKSICADYFMEAPLHSASQADAEQSRRMLDRLITNAAVIGAADIVIPCVDQSTLLDSLPKQTAFIKALQAPLKLAEQLGVNLSLETDLPPEAFLNLLQQFESPSIKVNYDTGNSAALGYNCCEELAAYGNYISDIHVKDRVLNGGSVALGTGNTDFKAFFDVLGKINYTGPFIMQAYRDDEGVQIFKQQLAWIRPFLSAWSKGEAFR